MELNEVYIQLQKFMNLSAFLEINTVLDKLDALVLSGYLIEKNNSYYITSKGRELLENFCQCCECNPCDCHR